MIFLLEYDRSAGVLVSISSFDVDCGDKAYAKRLELELKLLKEGVQREVVLLEAESEDALRRTHNRYFRGVKELIDAGDEDVRSTADDERTRAKRKSPQ